ncbi:MAG: hypothetical protein COA88_12975 [Kordia sp.]|nr:MAG: hypothetical protein COA88_12975 [Kordia sp.]
MKEFVVSRNLEKEPLVYGLIPRFFYIFLGMVVCGGFAGFFLLFRLISGGSSFFFLFYLFMWVSSLITYHSYFHKVSKKEKYNFKKKRITMSNRDLLETL